MKRNDIDAYPETGRAFHQGIVALSGNPRPTGLVLSLRGSMRLFGID